MFVLPAGAIPVQERLADVRPRVPAALFDASIRHVSQTLQYRLHDWGRLYDAAPFTTKSDATDNASMVRDEALRHAAFTAEVCKGVLESWFEG